MSVVPILADEGGHDIAVVSVFACHIFQRIVTSAGQGVCSPDPNAAIPPLPVDMNCSEGNHQVDLPTSLLFHVSNIFGERVESVALVALRFVRETQFRDATNASGYELF